MALMRDPSPDGRFGDFGGRYLPESLVPACAELEAAFTEAWADPAFHDRYEGLLRDYGGRPTPVTECHRLSERLGVRVLLKREDLAHTGSHKINNVIGQALLTERMGKRRMIAETGAGQHGVATATAAALFGFECRIYMGEVDVERQALNVFRMKLLGAEVIPVSLRQPHPQGRHQRDPAGLGGHRRVHPLLPGLGDGPPPVPVDGAGVPAHRGRGGGRAVPRPSSTGPTPTWWWPAWAADPTPPAPSPASSTPRARLVGVEPEGGAAIGRGVPGVVHGSKSFLLQDEHGQVLEAHSISAGLDYPGVGPRARPPLVDRPGDATSSAGDAEVLDAFRLLAETEGIIPALEPAHALAWVDPGRRHRRAPAGSTVLVTLSGRGDKDVAQVMDMVGDQL